MNFREKLNRFGQQKIPFIFIIDFELENPILFPLSSAAVSGIYFDFNGFSNCQGRDFTELETSFQWDVIPVSYQEYLSAFLYAQNEQKKGNSYLLNLTFPSEVETGLSLRQIFFHSHAKYRLLFEDKFTVFSPETFIKTDSNRIYTYPMKGTIDAAIPDAEKILTDNPKEQAEHITVVDLLRNDLSSVASGVTVGRYRYIESVEAKGKTILQTSSEISGDLPGDWKNRIGDILYKLLPAGSISGAPKEKTIGIIRRVEKIPRGYYTGVCGCFDGNRLDSAVMIRYIEQAGDKLFYRSGGGITVYSDPVTEYQEMLEKVYAPF